MWDSLAKEYVRFCKVHLMLTASAKFEGLSNPAEYCTPVNMTDEANHRWVEATAEDQNIPCYQIAQLAKQMEMCYSNGETKLPADWEPNTDIEWQEDYEIHAMKFFPIFH
jgi:hypothetical protein